MIKLKLLSFLFLVLIGTKTFSQKGDVKSLTLDVNRGALNYTGPATGFEFSGVEFRYQFVNCGGDVQLGIGYTKSANFTAFMMDGQRYYKGTVDEIAPGMWPTASNVSIDEVQADLYYGSTFLGKVNLNYIVGNFGGCFGETFDVLKQVGKDPKKEEYKNNVNNFRLTNVVVLRGDATGDRSLKVASALKADKKKKENSAQADSHLRYGHVEYGIGNYKKAKEHYQKAYALTQNPNTLKLIEDTDKAITHKAEQERLQKEAAANQNSTSSASQSSSSIGPVLTSTSTTTGKTATSQRKSTPSSQSSSKSNSASKDVYKKAEEAGKTLRQMEYEREAYIRQQREKLKYATNPGAYYLEKSGAWDSYNKLIDQIEQRDRKTEEQLDREWRERQRRQRLARIRQQEENARQDALAKQRAEYFYALPSNELPYNGINSSHNKLYYFFYHYTGGLRDLENINVSNVFAIGQYPDGSWPDSKEIMEDIYKVSIDPRKYTNVYHDIVGYFQSESEALSAYTAFKNKLNALDLHVKSLYYQGENANVVYGGNEAVKPINQLFAKAATLFNQKNYPEALKIYKEGLKQNGGNFNKGLFMNTDMEAIGYIHYLQKNHAESKKWFEKAAENGSVYSLRTLSQMYFSGIGSEKNPEKAITYLSKAVELGDLQSESDLALYYFNNNHPLLAEKIMVQVANNWDQPMEVRNRFKLLLAKAFAYGQNGFLKIIDRSKDYFSELVFDQKVLEAQYEYAMVSVDVGLWSSCLIPPLQDVINNPEQPEDKRNNCRVVMADAILFKHERTKKCNTTIDRAMEQYLILKEKGYDVDDRLGLCYLEKKNSLKAFDIHKDGIYSGFYHYDGKDVPQDYAKAVAVWEQQSSQYPEANIFLAVAHFTGKGFPKNEQLAKDLFQEAYEEADEEEFMEYYNNNFKLFLRHFPEFMKDHDALNSFLGEENPSVAKTNETIQDGKEQSPYDAISKAMRTNPYTEMQGYYFAFKGDKMALLDSVYNFVVPFKYESIELVGRGAKGIVRLNGKYGALDKIGVETIPPKYEALKMDEDDDKYIVAKLNGKYGHIDNHGNIKTPFMYERADFFYNGLAEVKLNGKVGYINIANQMVIRNQFEDGYAFIGSAGVTAAKKNGKWGYIDREGKTVIPFKFHEAGYFHSGKAWVKDSKGEGFYIDMKGKKIK